ncbi:MAG: hypothetical protein KDC23_01245 [Actinobacteria bacterium]|nr:hypothetical protein [Actinomycetota bacterium]
MWRRHRRLTSLLATTAVVLATGVGAAGSAAAAEPDDQRNWVVGLGDSFMSGEGASWMGKNYRSGSLGDWTAIAYGSSLEQTFPGDFSGAPGGMCHRSASAAMFAGGSQTTGKNLACSGARTYSTVNSDGVYKPGIDFANGTGQAAQLQQFATEVTANGDQLPVIMVSIGGNDAGFADVVAYCAAQFVTPLASACWKSAGDPKSPVGAALASLPTVRDNVTTAFTNIKTAMDAAGRPADSYTISYQLPPMIVPSPQDMWPPLGGDHGWGRQDYGGCPFTDGDLTFFQNTLFPRLADAMLTGLAQAKQGALADVNVKVIAPAFTSHELCSKFTPPKDNGPQVNTVQPVFDAYAGQGGTWVAPIIINCIARNPDASCATKRYPTIMESVSGRVADAATLAVHPNYWGQRALAACHELIDQDPQYNGQVVRCGPAATGYQPLGLDSLGRPQMVVTGTSPL